MRTIGMPAGMWALFAGSFQRKLTDVNGGTGHEGGAPGIPKADRGTAGL